MRKRQPLLLASTLAAAMVGAALVYGLAQGAATAVNAPPLPAVARGAVLPEPEIGPPPTPAAPRPPRPAPRAQSPQESLSRTVDRLSRSADPMDAFAAYRIVTACIWARDHEAWLARHILPADRELLPTTQQACGDIASDQVQGRLRWLERAALAGVHHAATEMLKEGPDGLGIGGSSDIEAPENASWKQRVDAALDAGVHTCDPDSLESRINGYEGGSGVEPDRAQALTYWVAYMACRQRLAGEPGSALADASADSVAQRMATTLSAEQIATAVSRGQQLARDARPLPGDR